jgi:hypothetical protein
MIYGSKDDSTYVVSFRTATGEALAISIPRTEAAVALIALAGLGPRHRRVVYIYR